MKKDKKSNISKHIHINEECLSNFNLDCFSILDYHPTQFQIKTKEGMYIECEKANLNKQMNHLCRIIIISLLRLFFHYVCQFLLLFI